MRKWFSHDQDELQYHVSRSRRDRYKGGPITQYREGVSEHRYLGDPSSSSSSSSSRQDPFAAVFEPHTSSPSSSSSTPSSNRELPRPVFTQHQKLHASNYEIEQRKHRYDKQSRPGAGQGTVLAPIRRVNDHDHDHDHHRQRPHSVVEPDPRQEINYVSPHWKPYRARAQEPVTKQHPTGPKMERVEVRPLQLHNRRISTTPPRPDEHRYSAPPYQTECDVKYGHSWAVQPPPRSSGSQSSSGVGSSISGRSAHGAVKGKQRRGDTTMTDRGVPRW